MVGFDEGSLPQLTVRMQHATRAFRALCIMAFQTKRMQRRPTKGARRRADVPPTGKQSEAHFLWQVSSKNRLVVLKGHFSNPSLQVRKLLAAPTSALEVSDRPSIPHFHRQVQRRLAAEVVTDLVAAYRAGASVSELSVRYRVHRTTVVAHLDRHGIPRRGQEGKLTHEQVTEASRLYGSGWPLIRIGEHFHVDANTVRRVLRKVGVQLRRPGRPGSIRPQELVADN